MSRWARVVAIASLIAVASVGPALAVENVGGIFAIGTSARAQGLGGAFCALADDEGAVFHNPAGLSWYSGVGLSSLFIQQFGGVAYGTVTLAAPYVGFSASFLDSGTIPTDEGSFRYASQGITGSLGIPIGPVGIGLRWRFLRVSSPASGQGWALDPALMVVAEGIRIGLLYEGAFSSPISYASGTEEAFGRSLRLGAALQLEPAHGVLWNAAFEAVGLFSSTSSLAVGLETWIGVVGARVGFDGRGPTFGLSVRFMALEIDWAYASRSDLGDSHRVALALRF
ncbi:MAG: hypothetical protein WBC63_00650 [Candidatus Bipolaricaulia bacterium]